MFAGSVVLSEQFATNSRNRATEILRLGTRAVNLNSPL